MSIQNELNQIKNAVYGREVRQAIHDGIEKAYNDATSGGAGDTNLEVVLARGNYDALNKRLDASDSQLAEKASKEELNNAVGNLADATPLFAESVNDMTDTSKLYVNLVDGYIYMYKDDAWTSTDVAYQERGIGIDSVNLDNLSFTEKTRNVFNGVYSDIYLSANNYRDKREGENPKTAVIKVNPSTTYTVKVHDVVATELLRIAGMNEKPNPEYTNKPIDDRILAQTTGNPVYTFTTDENTHYIMICVSYSGNEYVMQVEEGEQPTPYTPSRLIPKKYITEETEEESIEEVHKKLPRKNIVPLVLGSEDEEPMITGATLDYDIEKDGKRAYKINSISISTARLTFDVDTDTDAVQAAGMRLYVPEPEKVSHAFIRLTKKDGSPDYRRSNKDFFEIGDLKKGWNYLRYPTWRNNHTGLRGLSSVSVEIVPTQVPTSVTLSEVWLETSEKAKMIFVEDAQFKTFYDIAYPDLVERNIPVTWALRISNIGGETGTVREQMTLNQIREVSKENNNVVTWHSYSSQTSASMTPEETKIDVINAQKWLLSNGFDGGSFKGAWFQNTAPNHKAAHDYLVTSATPFGNSNLTIWPFVNQYEVPRIDLHGTGISKIDELLATLKETRGLVVFYTHGVSDNPGGSDITEEEWNTFIDKIDVALGEGWLEATTFNELNERYKIYDEMKF